jgi:putative glutamine amidotransferase
MAGPVILITTSDPGRSTDPALARRKQARYEEAVARQGGVPRLVSPATPRAERDAALQSMAGLLLSGGPDLAPRLYGASEDGSEAVDPERDGLEHEAWEAAATAGRPVLGICRGHQAINVFSGGRLTQHVQGHRTPSGAAAAHPLRIAPGTRLARILFPTNVGGGVLEVNSFHHQAVRPAELGSGLVVGATSSSPAGEIVEALETRSGRFVIGVQCHPERTETTPAAFERLFRVFVDGARGAALDR